jgi:hypothetical protein
MGEPFRALPAKYADTSLRGAVNEKTPFGVFSTLLHVLDDVRTYFITQNRYFYIPNLTADKAEIN